MNEAWEWIAGIFAALWIASLGWIAKLHFELQTKRADREAIAAAQRDIEELKREFRTEQTEGSERRRRIHERLEKQNERFEEYKKEQHTKEIDLVKIIWRFNKRTRDQNGDDD